MTRNSKGLASSYRDEICSVLAGIEDPDQMRRFLEEILTPAERKDLALRWELMRRLTDGVPQRQIAEQLGVSLCKITRGAKILKSENAISRQQLTSRRSR